MEKRYNKIEDVHVKLTPRDKAELQDLAKEYNLTVSSLLLLLFYNFADNPEWQKTFRLTRKKKEAGK